MTIPNNDDFLVPTAAELRDQALALLREGCDARDVAEALGIDLTTLHQLTGQCPECTG